jgi:DNA polymerase III sliding clamp (beta) subunit (PCNA family)
VETVPAEFEGDEPVISFNPHYLLDGLNAAAIDAPARSADPPADGESPRQPGGRIRIEFTSPAKPALITWAADPVPVAAEPEAGPGGAGQEDPSAVAAEPEAGPGGAGQEDPSAVAAEPEAGPGGAGQEDPSAVAAEPDTGARNVAAFRYLVVPLRVPARG